METMYEYMAMDRGTKAKWRPQKCEDPEGGMVTKSRY